MQKDRNAQWKEKKQLAEKMLKIAMTAILLVSMAYLAREAARLTGGKAVQQKEICIVVDAGHGGKDPGKVGTDGCLEKDINLQIAKKVRTYLEAADIRVVMTREDDSGLYDADASRKKVQDMKRRVEMIHEAAPALTVSIHQNSYGEAYVKGAQVFYYANSQKSKALAEQIQNRLNGKLDPENRRQAKANDSYYLLKKTDSPIVIVECGFLSNPEEAAKLQDPVYQDRCAWQIVMAILQYLNGNS